jgi:pyruvate dehydrogenase E2 component (dihydrolipoamide acetyltransferase)
MAVEIAIPKLGMTMSEATLVEWKASEGDRVEQGAVVLVIETEKVQWNVEAAASGFLHILVPAGEKAEVGAVVGLIAATQEELQKIQKEAPGTGAAAAAREAEAPPLEAEAASEQAKEGERVRITPAARKMAQEHMIDITRVSGTGPGGRITREDIEREIEARKKAPKAKEMPAPALYGGRRVRETLPLKGMRKAIAEHMHRSLSISAQLTLLGEFDMTEMVKVVQGFREQEKVIGTRITYTEIFVYAAARALKEHPYLNCSLIDDEIKFWEDINIGVAVGLGEKGDEGLIVPVVRNADKKSLVEISLEVKALVDKARTGKLLPDDLSGGTFTITSVGPRGVGIYNTPIINQPESAILGTFLIKDRPVVKEGQIVIAPIMTWALTFDHRTVDGLVAERFMARLKDLIENPGLLLVT